MLSVSGLYIYPIKSLSGIPLNTAAVTSRGFQHDRRMMLVDENNSFITQRVFPQMALLQPILSNDGLFIHHKRDSSITQFVPAQPAAKEVATVTIWDDTCTGLLYDKEINDWFSRALGITCKLVYMPETTARLVDTRYAHGNEITSFADDYPMLLIGQSSLDDLNRRLPEPLPMNRFRPNIVFTGGDPYLEDRMASFIINEIEFKGVKPCARCVLTTVNQDDASKSKEPLKTLATYRQSGNKILFGQNLLHYGQGNIHVGDSIDIKEYQPAVL